MSQLSALIGILITLILILFFAGMEAAFLTANRLNIELKKKQGSSEGLLSSRFADNPTTFIGTSIFGGLLCLVIYGLFFNEFFNQLFWAKTSFHNENLQMVLNTIISTIFVAFFGRFLARLFFNRNDKLFHSLLSFFSIFYSLFNNIIKVFISFSGGILKYLFNVRLKPEKQPFGRMQVEHLFQQAKDSDEMGSQDLNTYLFENALTLPNIKIRQCLVPRTEIIGVELHTSIDDLRQSFIKHIMSKLVVYEGSIDNIIGYVTQQGLFKRPGSIEQILLPTFTVPESMSIIDLLTRFSKERKSLAWVVDEFGGTAGIITVENILSELFGEMQHESDKEAFVEQKVAENEYIFSGRLELEYLNEKYDFEFPENNSETLSGYIIKENKDIPKQKERIIVDNYEFDIISVTDTRIGMVKMRILR
ncbi:Hemolysin, contains CBS domains [Arachidicoccus rhizosphaerae]|uniref:Hemolysin, contains CBS domains n=1 Tax=Arachidicoccus rhizosphaerae TaxID=551991 RepID=A0A1H3XC75_9BACT|nr:hemolysin family protein [Arachidicoccus rhizosphaerae]SDZ97015.1 Hemolysin, contains CBS domains [Arachidicoccus rhizosphaerae]